MIAMDKELLLKSRLAEADVEIPGVGVVRVRGLSRAEVLAMRKAADNDPQSLDGKRALVIERKTVAAAMVDPQLTESEVRRWQEQSPAGELEPVTDKIAELSGLSEGATKSGLPGAGDGPGSGVRDVPSGEAGDDGGPAPAGDE